MEAKSRTETHTPTEKTSKNQRKHIHRPPLHLEKMSQESQINKACDKEDTSSYSGQSFVQKDEENAHQARHIRERKNLQFSKDESKQKSRESSVKLKTTDCPKEEPLCDNPKEGASLRQMPSNLTSKMLDCEGKGAFGKTISAPLQTFPKREETTLKIVSPSHEDPWCPEDSPWDSSPELSLREKELHSGNDHKPNAEQVLNKNEQSFYNDIENKNVRTLIVTSRVKEDQEFAMQMTKNMNPNTTDWKLGIGPTPQSHHPKSHPELQFPCCNETKIIIEMKSHDMPAVINIYKETKRNQDLFQNPLCADNFNANYFTSMDSRLKDVSSSALHNDRTSGVSAIEKLKEDMQSLKNDIEMLKVKKLSCEKEKVQLQKEVSESSEKEKCRSHENRMLWDEIAKLRLEMDSVMNQTLEMGKEYFEDVAIGKEKKDRPQNTITETVSQHNAQLEVLRAELMMLYHKLEIEQQNRRRLEAQVESYQSRLATAVQDHEHCQTSKRELQLAFKRARDECFCLWDKMNLDMSNLKHNNEILSQRLSEVESKNCSLEIELHHIRDALKERTLVLEGVERDLSQKQCQKEETDHVHQKEPGKVDTDIGKQESLMERLSHLQSEMMLLQQQLDQDHNQADREEKTVINTQDQIWDIMKIFDCEHQKYVLWLHEKMMELINKWHRSKEIILQYENDNAERNAFVRQLQQETADTKRKLSTIETSLESESCHHMHLEDKKPDFKNKLDQSRSQTRRASQEISELLTSTHNASNISHLELRTPLLQTSQDDSRKRNRKPLVTLPRNIGTQKMFGKETNFGSEAASRGQH